MRYGEIIESSKTERQSIVDNMEDEYRLPNLATIVPPEHMHPIVKLGYPKVTIYRAVPSGVTDIRPGDWVALDKSYAASHERGTMLSKRVPAEDVAWAGTDQNEYYYVPRNAIVKESVDDDRTRLYQAMDDARTAFHTEQTRANLQTFYAARAAWEAFEAEQSPPPVEVTPDDYRGQHSAPTRESGSPMHDLTGTYPADFYTGRGREYANDSADMAILGTILSLHNRPNFAVTIYRTIPKNLPRKINVGDWVAITKRYAIDHGHGALQGQFQLVQKKVYARDLFTNGDSLQEWGYDPQPRVIRPPRQLKPQ